MVEFMNWFPESNGESKLAAVVREATEGMGPQPILSHFGLFGHAAIKSGATAAIGMVDRLRSGKGWHSAVVGSGSRSFGEDSSLQKCQGSRIRVVPEVPCARTITGTHACL